MGLQCLRCSAATCAALSFFACSKSSAPDAAVSATSPAAALASTAKGSNGNPCTLLTDSGVLSVLPNAKAGQVDRNKEKYGYIACIWDHPGERFFVQHSSHELGPWTSESEGRIDGFLDPPNQAAKKSVRFEALRGAGNRATAVIERKDEAKDVLRDVAQLVVQVSNRQPLMFSSHLPQRERSVAMKALDSLGSAVANRL